MHASSQLWCEFSTGLGTALGAGTNSACVLHLPTSLTLESIVKTGTTHMSHDMYLNQLSTVR